jgi:hypothetical protein
MPKNKPRRHSPRHRADYMREFMRAKRAAAHPDAKRYRTEAHNLLTTAATSLRPYAALVIWRDAANGYKPAQAALADPSVASAVFRVLIRAWTRQILGWAVQLPVPASLAESTTPEVRRVAHLVDQALPLAA